MYNKGNVKVPHSSKGGQALLAIFLSTLVIIGVYHVTTKTMTQPQVIGGMSALVLFFLRLFRSLHFKLIYISQQTIHNEPHSHHEKSQPSKNTDTQTLSELNRSYFQAKTTFKKKHINAMSVMEKYFYFSHKSKQWQQLMRLGQALFFLAISISIFFLSNSNRLFISLLLTLAIAMNIEGLIRAYETDKQAQVYKQKIDMLFRRAFSI